MTVQLTDYKANISMDTAVSAVQATSNYWQTMSNGRLSMSVASTETLNSRSASSGQRYSDMMNTITNELGWVANPYTALVVFVSTPTLSDGAYGAGWSYNGTSGRVIMPLPASLTRSVLTHEFGHVLGLMHANSLECGSGAQDVATNSDGTFADASCSVREYGDSMDLMGVSQTSQPTISSTLWEFGGFGTGREIRDVGKAGNTSSYTLTAWAGGADGRAVKFTDPVSGEVYYLELRLPVGYDATTATNGNRGVKIVQRFGAGSLILMPDSRRFAGYYSSRHAWQAGETFTTHAGSRVSVNWISDTAAGITIESTAAAAVRAIADLAAVSPGLGRAVTGLKTGLNGGVSQGYENGAIYWTAANGAHISSGVIRDAWGAQGWEAGVLGYPTTDVRTAANGAQSQGYQNGAIYWTAATGARISTGAIRDAWGAQGWEAGPLGYPTTDVKTAPNGAKSQGYENGAIYWTAANGARISSGVIRDAWGAQGWEAGPLGYPTTDVRTAPNGAKSQGYENGAIYWTAATGARISTGAIRDAWAAQGWESGPLGYPTTDIRTGPKNGLSQGYENGAIYWTAATGARTTSGVIRDAWAAQGWEAGPLGYPTTDVRTAPNGAKSQGYENGAIYWTAATGARISSGVIRDAWAAQGWESGPLGYPTTDVKTGPNSGLSQGYENGAIYWTAATGARSTSGVIRDAWAAQGAESGPLGYPTTDVRTAPNGAKSQGYENGAIYWTAATGAHISSGAIRDAWAAQGWEAGPLGYPTTDVRTAPNGAKSQGYQNGAIYWTAANGARISSGVIRDAWAAQGWESGPLGYPTTDIRTAPNGAKSQGYENGAIYWTAATGAHVSSGAIRDAWAAQGWETGPLGYPTTDVKTAPNGAKSQGYQNGAIYWTTTTGAQLSPNGPIRNAWGAQGWESGPLGYPTTGVYSTGNGNLAQNFQGGRIDWSSTAGVKTTLSR
ncbi:M43 family zinc metalloprotease [Arthrobacter sp. NicSoilB4]|uniref:M43 family zinc metalloprotease n=1 Tax=Arthrobacter sp. NicSoilB4 TaxID=2830997 RepID=UPI001CC67D92|nr:M43 family zinc metalloprotease [Arthrobacter sp. NicSoilB4]